MANERLRHRLAWRGPVVTVGPDAPAITSFTVDDASLLTGQQATFSWTTSGSATAWSLDTDGDGDADWTGTNETSRTHTYGSAGSYTPTLTISGPGGSDSEPLTGGLVVTVPPISITGFSVTPTSPTVDVAATFSWTTSGEAQAGATLDPGDGTTPYTLTTQTSQAHTYTAEDIHTATLVVTGATSSDTDTIVDIDVVAPISPGTPPTSFTVVTTAKTSDGAAGDWATPIGIAPDNGAGAIPSTKFNNIWARSQSGGWSYVQIEQTRAWAADGSLKLATGHFKIPTGYVDGEKIDIVVGNDDGPPADPDWDTITSNHTADIEIDVSVYDPKIYLIATTGTAAVGDVISIEITDSIGTQTYTRTVRSNRAINLVMRDLCLELSLDPSGRYRAMKDPVAKILPPPPDGDATPDSADWSVLTPASFNVAYQKTDGVDFTSNAAGYVAPLILPGWPSAPVNQAFGSGRQYPIISGDPLGGLGYGFYLWPRWASGNPENFTVNVTVTRAGGSTLAIRNALTSATSTINGEPIVMQTPTSRVAHTLTWNAATESPRSPWFSGKLVRQAERVADMPSRSVSFRIYASWDTTGALIDTYIQAENSKMWSGAADVYYDVTAIRVGGVNQLDTPEKLADHRDLHHYLWTKWRWHKPKPKVMCDPSAYMRTQLHGSFETFPTDDNTDTLQIFSRGTAPAAQGSGFNGGDLYKINPVQFAARGGFVIDRANQPLRSGLLTFDRLGGARPSIALYDLFGAVFLTSNVWTHWDDFFAIADNCYSAFPFYVREERAVAAGAIDSPDTVDVDQAHYAPHIYKHISNSLPQDVQRTGFGRAKAMLLGVARQVDTFTYTVQRQFTPNYKVFSLYQGSALGGSGFYAFPQPSHSSPHPAKVAYMIRPEACFLDSLEQWAWAMYSSVNGPAPPKAGGQVFDADHRASWAVVNGVRGFAWPWRDTIHAASMVWDAHPRRTHWTRVVGDGAEYFSNIATRTWGGIFHVGTHNWQGSRTSDSWTTSLVDQKQGDTDNQWNNTTRLPTTADLFKSAYCTQVAVFAQMAEVANLTSALSQSMYWHRAFDDVVNAGRPWYLAWGTWNNYFVDPTAALVRLQTASSAGFSVGDTVTVSTSGFAGTINHITGNEIGVRDITNWGQPLAGQTLTNGTATTTLNNVSSGRGYSINQFGTGLYSKNGLIASDAISDYLAAYDTAPWLYSNNFRYLTAPANALAPVGWGSSSGYYNEIFHWKALYGQALYGTDPVEKAKAQTWIDHFNTRYDPGSLQPVGQISAAYPYSHPDYRLRIAIGLQHCWVAPSEIAGQAW